MGLGLSASICRYDGGHHLFCHCYTAGASGGGVDLPILVPSAASRPAGGTALLHGSFLLFLLLRKAEQPWLEYVLWAWFILLSVWLEYGIISGHFMP